MPDERTRSLRWGAEMLLELQDDTTVPLSLRMRAAELQTRYPTAKQLRELLATDAASLPSEWVTAIGDGLQLFEELSRSRVGTDETRRSLLFTLRHYPDRFIIDLLGRSVEGFSVSRWLQPE